jgi:predicted ATPase
VILDALPSPSAPLLASDLHAARGQLLFASGRVAEALAAFRLALEGNPEQEAAGAGALGASERLGLSVQEWARQGPLPFAWRLELRRATGVGTEPKGLVDEARRAGRTDWVARAAVAWIDEAVAAGNPEEATLAAGVAAKHLIDVPSRQAYRRSIALAAAHHAPGQAADLLDTLVDLCGEIGDVHGEAEGRIWRARVLAPSDLSAAQADIVAAEAILGRGGDGPLGVALRAVGGALRLPYAPPEAPPADLRALCAAARCAEATTPEARLLALEELETATAAVQPAHRSALRALLDVPLRGGGVRRGGGEGLPVLYLSQGQAWFAGKRAADLSRSPLQYRLLQTLVDGPALARGDLFARVWERSYLPPSSDNSLFVAINRLRSALGSDGPGLTALGGGGYRIEAGAAYLDAAPTPIVEREEVVGPTGVATNLVVDTTSFHGRIADLDQIGRRFSEGVQLVSLLGMGGVGKTRLAREYAARLVASRGVDEVWWCALDSAREAGVRVDVAVARALGVPPSATLDVQAQLARVLARRGRLLLVLDGCERLSSEVTEAVRTWSRAAPHASFLVTSRERLGAPGECAIEVDPLQPGDALALFVARARTAGGEVEPMDPALARLLTRVDHLPLGIELTAVRSPFMSPAVLDAHLSSSLSLARKTATVPRHRHETLRDTVAWSWDFLSAAERDVLAACSVFVGGFDLDAAEALFGAFALSGDATDLLGALRDKSLLRIAEPSERRGEARYQMFHVVAEFAAVHLTEAKRSEVQAWHAAWFAGLGEALYAHLEGPDGDPALARLTLERANLEVAFERARHRNPRAAIRLGSVLPFLVETGSRRLEFFDVALSLAEVHAPDASAHLLVRRGQALHRLGRSAEATKDYERVLQSDAKPSALIDALGQLAQLRGILGASEGSAFIARALEMARASGDVRREARCLATQAGAASNRADYDVGCIAYEQALALARSVDYTLLEWNILSNLVEGWREVGDVSAANAAFECCEGLTFREAHSRAALWRNAGPLLHGQGHHQRATAMLEEALRLCQDMGNTPLEADVAESLGIIAADLGRTAEATARLASAADLQRALPAVRRPSALGWLGLLDLDQGRIEIGRERLEVAAASGTGPHRAFFAGQLGSVAHLQGDLDAAGAQYASALSLFRRDMMPHLRAPIAARLAAVHAAMGREGEAAVQFALAEAWAERAQVATLTAAIDVWRGFADLRVGDVGAVRARSAKAVDARQGRSFAQRSMEVRFALRLLDAALNAGA